MVYFVGTSSSLRKALLVAMAAMHLHIAQTGLFMGISFRIQEVSGTNFAQNQNCPCGVMQVKLDTGVVSCRPKSVYL